MEIVRKVDALRERVSHVVLKSFSDDVTVGIPCPCGCTACKTVKNGVTRICIRCLDYFSKFMSNKTLFDDDFIEKHPWIRRCSIALCKQYIGVTIAAYSDNSEYNDTLEFFDAKGKCWCCSALTWRDYRGWNICEGCRNEAKNISTMLVQKMMLAGSIYIHRDINIARIFAYVAW